jgi:hypothetical protein
MLHILIFQQRYTAEVVICLLRYTVDVGPSNLFAEIHCMLHILIFQQRYTAEVAHFKICLQRYTADVASFTMYSVYIVYRHKLHLLICLQGVMPCICHVCCINRYTVTVAINISQVYAGG